MGVDKFVTDREKVVTTVILEKWDGRCSDLASLSARVLTRVGLLSEVYQKVCGEVSR